MGEAVRQTEELFTADGTPLRLSLARALRRQKLRALLLVAPLFVFISVTFLIPIGDMLFRSVENHVVGEILPRRAPGCWPNGIQPRAGCPPRRSSPHWLKI